MKLHISLLCVSLFSLHHAHCMEQGTDHQKICTAFSKRDTRTIERFLKETTDPNPSILCINPEDQAGEPLKFVPLLDLAYENDMADIIAQLRARGVSIAQPDEKGNTPLARALAAEKHDLATLTFLITEETINRQNNAQATPLHILMYQKGVSIPVLKLLCKEGARIDLQDAAGNTPIHYAVLRDDTGRLLNLLFDAHNVRDGEEVPFLDMQNKQGATPLHLAVERFLEAEYTSSYLQIIDHLLDLGADLSIENIQGVSSWGLIQNALPDNERAQKLDAILKRKYQPEEKTGFWSKLANLLSD